MNMCELIKIKRMEKGYTLERMAEFLGHSKSAYAHWEKGRRQWIIDIIVEVCEILDLELILNKNGVFIMEGNKMCKVELDVKQKYIEVVADYESYKIIKVYAKKEMLKLKDKERISLVVINKENIVETLKEAMLKFGDDYTDAYAIVNKQTNEIMDDCIVTTFFMAESLYYKYYAPAIETFEVKLDDDYVAKKEVVYRTNTFKVARNYDSFNYTGFGDVSSESNNMVKETEKVMLKIIKKPFYLYDTDNKHYNMAYTDYNYFDDAMDDVNDIEIYELLKYFSKNEGNNSDMEKSVKEFENDENRITTETWESFYIEE